MKGNKKKISSIFDNCHETASQEIFLRSCGYAQRGVPPDSDPSVVGVSPPLNDGTASHPAPDDSETDRVLGSASYEEEDLVESHAVRFVSPPESEDAVDSEEEAADRTVAVESKVDDERMETPAKKKLKVPLRDVVKAIVMNSRNTEEEEDREVIEKTSFVQILMQKGFKFP